ncbi:TPA: type I methionyl aminopeptidase [Kluyvera intermedia]|uniref:Methionine aminopeptidase n=2 Tax=Enterobacteriaceae TaxID=543 RepID=A0A9P3WHA0_KLUIN|nr:MULTISPECIES: type I methionyl aminopeptidase [Enterobacteriaceae]AKL14681.1 methionine aminopeptidase [Phytobacter ursingii]ORJ48397.1 type I methionyl aminopeptidase [Kluyvera intermedia]HAT2206438.1 type I methionyl aminopeptidase [Kluyvera intermedia]HAT2517112.1 type I methionyl aminopeptidase [Kluyvera intermedia]HAT2604937.1 type I methionyl aminopeptidase [Kluyvera intermedia]
MTNIKLHSPQEIEMARAAGHAAANVLEMIKPHVRAGVTTDEIDTLCHDFIRHELKVIPANIGYNGYTRTVCTSVNHVVCHGIPSEKRLKDGDIINIDVAIIKDGWYGDTSRMYFVGEPSVRARRLTTITYESMVAGIKAVRPGATLGDIGAAIQEVAESAGFSVVKEYCGHGVGQEYHAEPQILHYGRPGTGLVLKKGMIFTIEPMLNAGKAATSVLSDGWTVVTKDRSLSAQWEHMVAVTDTGFDLLTPWPDPSPEYSGL